jgi:hypothetical protein
MITRRGFLTALGGLAVAGAGGATWRAVDQGVFATGTGGAYTAWDEWNPPGDDILNLVRAAVLAASAHNSQPWQFRLAPDRIDLIPDTTRTIGAMDPLFRELHISMGCALENLILAAEHQGRAPTADGWTVHLGHGSARTSPLFEAIPKRHTNRAAYDERPIGQATLDELGALSDNLVWLDKAKFSELTIRATQAIIADPGQSRDSNAWIKTDWNDLQSTKDGPTVDASGQPEVVRALGKIFSTSHEMNNDFWLQSTRDVQLPTAAAVGALVAKDPLDPLQRLAIGRDWQRMHLWATTKGLAMQPINQINERADRERTTSAPPEFTNALAHLSPNTVFTFRIGYPTTQALRSPRRRAEEVLAR